MTFESSPSPRDRAQELAYDAMERVGSDSRAAVKLCREALNIHPDCVDAMVMLADLECRLVVDHVAALRKAVEAGRRDLGPAYFERERGYFWGLIETRSFMRAMGQLAQSLLEWGTDACVDEAIVIQEEMLELNPNDNQGTRDVLVGCYLARGRYDVAAKLLKKFKDDQMAVLSWARVLLAHATEDLKQAGKLLSTARQANRHVELYLTGRKRRPRRRVGFYSPGDDSEAVLCADLLGAAWKKHPQAREWLKQAVQHEPA